MSTHGIRCERTFSEFCLHNGPNIQYIKSRSFCRFPPISQQYRPTIRYDTKYYFNVRSKAHMSQLNLPHGTDN